MKKLIVSLFIALSWTCQAAELDEQLSTVHSESISVVFTSMPDSIFPLLTSKNRHDMVDFYNNKMEAKVRNRLGDYALLDTLTEGYLKLTPSKSSTIEMKLMETDDSTAIVCLIQTVKAPVSDSSVKFYDSEWRRLHWLELPMAETAEFFNEIPDSVAHEMKFVQQSIDDLRLIAVSVSPDEPVFTMQLAVDELAKEEKKIAKRHLVSVRYRWTGRDFVKE